ncbi:hypothetical protein ACH5AL_18800 [Actinacidiphila glaucinigra]|uniref:hypothetical protein n=1 Tax=Actinacidiphila glaucinigra TaxID=235986 RepID=UPI00378894EE
MNTVPPSRTLFLSPRVTETGHALAAAAHRRGMAARTLSTWRAPQDAAHTVGPSLYAGPLFADAVAADLGPALLGPTRTGRPGCRSNSSGGTSGSRPWRRPARCAGPPS